MPLRRTIVYIDGFNFYYGQIRGTPWKWLDPEALFRRVLGPQNQIVKIKYFTARVQPSPRDPNVNVRQDIYLQALAAHCKLIEIHYGHFLRHKVRMEHANPPPGTVEIWKNEEKGSDVNGTYLRSISTRSSFRPQRSVEPESSISDDLLDTGLRRYDESSSSAP